MKHINGELHAEGEEGDRTCSRDLSRGQGRRDGRGRGNESQSARTQEGEATQRARVKTKARAGGACGLWRELDVHGCQTRGLRRGGAPPQREQAGRDWAFETHFNRTLWLARQRRTRPIARLRVAPNRACLQSQGAGHWRPTVHPPFRSWTYRNSHDIILEQGSSCKVDRPSRRYAFDFDGDCRLRPLQMDRLCAALGTGTNILCLRAGSEYNARLSAAPATDIALRCRQLSATRCTRTSTWPL